MKGFDVCCRKTAVALQVPRLSAAKVTLDFVHLLLAKALRNDPIKALFRFHEMSRRIRDIEEREAPDLRKKRSVFLQVMPECCERSQTGLHIRKGECGRL